MERKRFLAVVMTVMMVISMIPSMVFAAASSGELGGKLKIKGLAAVGVVLSADYAKVTPEEVTDEDFTFSWSRQTGEKELTQVGTEKTYTITQDDLGCRLVLDLTPVDGSSGTGSRGYIADRNGRWNRECTAGRNGRWNRGCTAGRNSR